MPDNLSDILASVSPGAISLDAYGRLVITDRDVAQRVSQLVSVQPALRDEGQNLGCCKNGYECGCDLVAQPVAGALADITSRFLGLGNVPASRPES